MLSKMGWVQEMEVVRWSGFCRELHSQVHPHLDNVQAMSVMHSWVSVFES